VTGRPGRSGPADGGEMGGADRPDTGALRSRLTNLVGLLDLIDVITEDWAREFVLVVFVGEAAALHTLARHMAGGVTGSQDTNRKEGRKWSWEV
jgi:hypothetical protein